MIKGLLFYYRSLDLVNGVFMSPNFPQDYPNDLRCSWSMTVNNDSNIVVEFLHFSVSSIST